MGLEEKNSGKFRDDFNTVFDELDKYEKRSQRINLGLAKIIGVFMLLCFVIGMMIGNDADDGNGFSAVRKGESNDLASKGKIIYGAKFKGSNENTANLVTQAIKEGFRHIATAGMHGDYRESSVGSGWKASGVSREQLYLQTHFVAKSINGWNAGDCHISECPPPDDISLEDEVHLSIKSSLHNLQTEYIDAVLIHNFRAKLQPYEDVLREYRVLEEYVDKKKIRHLGIVSCHNEEFLKKLYEDARIKPSIIQNRFHANRGFDAALRPFFKEYNLQNQLFWVLTGNGGTLNNDKVKEIAKKKGLSPAATMYSFTISIGASPMIGSQSIDHLKEDVAMLKDFTPWTKDELKEFASILRTPSLVES